jgi:CRP/FNR family cyclic AMP-dependent transcriptional regulator
MDVTTVIGFVAAGLSIAAHSMRTMVPLRATGIANNFAFMTYGFLFGSLPTMVLHAILFPLNVYRLSEMLKLVKAVKSASAGDLNMDWLKPFMSHRTITKGQILFRKGDEADHMFFVVDGRLHLHEIDVDIPPGTVVGELGMLAPSRKRTQTLECTESGSILTIGYEKIEQLYYQNPTFGFYFLRLSSARLFQNIARLERLLAERDAELDRLRPQTSTATLS